MNYQHTRVQKELHWNVSQRSAWFNYDHMVILKVGKRKGKTTNTSVRLGEILMHHGQTVLLQGDGCDANVTTMVEHAGRFYSNLDPEHGLNKFSGSGASQAQGPIIRWGGRKIYGAAAHFGPAPSEWPVMLPTQVVLAKPKLGCSSGAQSSYAGQVVLVKATVQQKDCSFFDKVANAQERGAVGG